MSLSRYNSKQGERTCILTVPPDAEELALKVEAADGGGAHAYMCEYQWEMQKPR